jgi:hypothetical protein
MSCEMIEHNPRDVHPRAMVSTYSEDDAVMVPTEPFDLDELPNYTFHEPLVSLWLKLGDLAWMEEWRRARRASLTISAVKGAGNER